MKTDEAVEVKDEPLPVQEELDDEECTMRHLEFARKSKEDRQKRKEQHLESVEQIQERISRNYNLIS